MILNGRVFAVICSVGSFIGVGDASAELEQLADMDLREHTGQAFIAIDQNRWENRDYIRVNLGMDIAVQMNADDVKLGEYHRYENGDACHDCNGSESGLEAQPADLWLKNFSLGTIAEENGVQSDGQYYQAGQVVPFNITDPYLEFALEDNVPIGIRLGFRGAQGVLGANILSLTGNLPVDIKDTARALRDAPNRPWWIDVAGALLGNTPVESKAQLVTGPNGSAGNYDYSTGGILDPVRASWIGIPDGAPFSIGPIFLIGTINFATDSCNLFGIPTCFPLSIYQSIDIGERQNDNTYKPVDGLFSSFQTQDLNWFNPDTARAVTATQGAFLNIPDGGIELKLSEAFNGLPRQRVEYIDRGVGLF
ncbi:hypothetical protein OLMES_2378 [Oleiphilus messinensis]|uniref:Uncharacterized protein n=1 Tax=Oleiphilus messinensis TaxID=141451 RepID=A0A1Y0I7L6_9GAMM|nr:hypothetical protein [Oleiphilus messinensis]ARU56441.1 hypothetical protein OLMES_2378 [Oleiphilus messinensis]